MIRAAAALMGQPYETAQGIDGETFGLVRSLFDLRLDYAWNIENWPDLCPIEFRAWDDLYDFTQTYAAGKTVVDYTGNARYLSLAANNTAALTDASKWWPIDHLAVPGEWDATTVYAVGDLVFYPTTPQFWYVLVATATAGTRPTDTGFWVAVSKSLPAEFPVNVTGRTASSLIEGRVLAVYAADPHTTRRAPPIGFENTPDGCRVDGNPGWAWFLYRQPRPVISGLPWDQTATYAADDQVYYLNTTSKKGDFYDVLGDTTEGQSPATDPDLFALVELPEYFNGYLARATYADWLRSDGNDDKADSQEGMALEQLGRAKDEQMPTGVQRLNFEPNNFRR
jgi:hypothetical protein